MLVREVICSADTDLIKKNIQNLRKPRGISIYFNIKGGGGLRKEGIVDSCCDVFGKVSVDIPPVTA